ncbi:unnamed protein product [Cochlearia groenlandica]
MRKEKEEEEEEEEPLSPMARMFQSPGIDNCIVITIGFKAKIDVEVIVNDLKCNVSKHPRFSSKLSNNGERWIKTEVNVEDHVYAPNIDPKEIGENGQNFVDDYVSNLTMIPLDRSKPLWDTHILNVKTCDAESVIVIRCHHSLGDGTSLMSLLLASTRKTSNLEEFPTMSTSSKRRKMVSRGIIFTMFYATKMIWNTIADLFMLLATILFLKDTETPLKGGLSVRTRFSHRFFSLDDFRFIKNEMDMTINDVLLGVTQAALSNYLNKLYVTPQSQEITHNNKEYLFELKYIFCFCMKSFAEMMVKGSKWRWGNHLSFIVFPMSISLETDPLVYLSKAKSTMDRKKNSFHSSLVYFITWLGFKTFGTKVLATLFKRPVLHTTTSISNIVGPIEEISFHGNAMAYIVPSSYGQSQPLGIHYLSYAKKMVISIGFDPIVIPDPHKLFDEMEYSLKAMKDSICEVKLL